jgi:gas vesicle structural protein
MTEILSPKCELSLSELLDRALNKGVVLIGDVTISIADVDLVYLGVKVLLASVETAEKLRPPPKHGISYGALRDAAE